MNMMKRLLRGLGGEYAAAREIQGLSRLSSARWAFSCLPYLAEDNLGFPPDGVRRIVEFIQELRYRMAESWERIRFEARGFGRRWVPDSSPCNCAVCAVHNEYDGLDPFSFTCSRRCPLCMFNDERRGDRKYRFQRTWATYYFVKAIPGVFLGAWKEIYGPYDEE